VIQNTKVTSKGAHLRERGESMKKRKGKGGGGTTDNKVQEKEKMCQKDRPPRGEGSNAKGPACQGK